MHSERAREAAATRLRPLEGDAPGFAMREPPAREFGFAQAAGEIAERFDLILGGRAGDIKRCRDLTVTLVIDDPVEKRGTTDGDVRELHGIVPDAGFVWSGLVAAACGFGSRQRRRCYWLRSGRDPSRVTRWSAVAVLVSHRFGNPAIAFTAKRRGSVALCPHVTVGLPVRRRGDPPRWPPCV